MVTERSRRAKRKFGPSTHSSDWTKRVHLRTPPDVSAHLTGPLRKLPLFAGPLIGRDFEVSTIRRLLLAREPRLLTLTGPPGVGKTRLALEVAAAMTGEFADGVVFVDLASASHPSHALVAVAKALDVREHSRQPIITRLVEEAGDRRILLVLDTLEHLLAATTTITEFLTACPGITVLATSRAALRLRYEREFPVLPLVTPSSNRISTPQQLSSVPAAALFIERARAAVPDFILDHSNAAAVAEICVRLDGLPLAIELAASRVGVLPPPTLLKRLQAVPMELSGDLRDLPARHQTLRRAIGWSYGLLGPREQMLFRRLAVLVAGFSIESAEAICTADHQFDILSGLSSLVDSNLLARAQDSGQQARFRMLDTLREYGLELLRTTGELEDLRYRHAMYFLNLAEQVEAELPSSASGTWLDLLEQEQQNLRGALRWMLDTRASASAFRLVGALWHYWEVRGYWTEGRAWIQEALALGGDALPVHRAEALYGAGFLAWRQGDYDQAQEALQQSYRLYRELDDRRMIGYVLNDLGLVAREHGDYQAAQSLFAESLVLRRELGDTRAIAISVYNLGVVAREQGDYPLAQRLFEESLALRRALNDRTGIAYSLVRLGQVVKEQGDPAAARHLLEQGLLIHRELGDRRSVSFALRDLAAIVREQRQLKAACELVQESLAIRVELGDKLGIAECLQEAAAVLCACGVPHRAVPLLATSATLRDTIGAPLPPSRRSEYERVMRIAHGAVGDNWDAAWAAGAAVSWQRGVEYATRCLAEALESVVSDRGPSLTPREREVAALIARGRTNREISTALSIGERTAENHVQNIFNKLGFSSRAQIAAWAAERGLLK